MTEPPRRPIDRIFHSPCFSEPVGCPLFTSMGSGNEWKPFVMSWHRRRGPDFSASPSEGVKGSVAAAGPGSNEARLPPWRREPSAQRSPHFLTLNKEETKVPLIGAQNQESVTGSLRNKFSLIVLETFTKRLASTPDTDLSRFHPVLALQRGCSSGLWLTNEKKAGWPRQPVLARSCWTVAPASPLRPGEQR